jgi:adenylate kinase
MRLILLGAPGVGKGLQGSLLAERHGLARISTGDLLREAVRQRTPVGRQAQAYMEAGELVPDELILSLVGDALAAAKEGFILDGFPRNCDQGRALVQMQEERGIDIDAVVVLEAPDDVLVRRISGRRSCPGCGGVFNIYFDAPATPGICDRCGTTLVERPDDTEATVRRRLDVYRAQTEPLVDFYRSAGVPVHVVDGDHPAEAVRAAIEDVLATA